MLRILFPPRIESLVKSLQSLVLNLLSKLQQRVRKITFKKLARIMRKVGRVCKVICECANNHVGNTGRTLARRITEHLRALANPSLDAPLVCRCSTCTCKTLRCRAPQTYLKSHHHCFGCLWIRHVVKFLKVIE